MEVTKKLQNENQGKGDNPQHHQHQRNADYCGHDVDGAPAFLALYAAI